MAISIFITISLFYLFLYLLTYLFHSGVVAK